MKLQISQNLKDLRRERGITQEQLAEVLNVSSQSVSRWELGICYPDLELLPAIANFFDVTVDSLIGMNQIRSTLKRNEIFTTALNFERQENWNGAIRVLRDAHKVYPNDDGLSAELALALSRTGDSRDREEAIMLSEAVMERCTNEKIRSTTRANLCFLYKETGLQDKAIAMGKTLPHVWECREILLPDLMADEHREEMVARSFNIVFQVLKDVAAGSGVPFSLGYTAEKAIDGNALLQYILHSGK